MGSMTLWEPPKNHNLVVFFEQLDWRHICDCKRAELNIYRYLGLLPNQNRFVTEVMGCLFSAALLSLRRPFRL